MGWHRIERGLGRHETNPVNPRPGRWDGDGINTMHITRDDANDKYVPPIRATSSTEPTSRLAQARPRQGGVEWTFPSAAEPLMQGVDLG